MKRRSFAEVAINVVLFGIVLFLYVAEFKCRMQPDGVLHLEITQDMLLWAIGVAMLLLASCAYFSGRLGATRKAKEEEGTDDLRFFNIFDEYPEEDDLVEEERAY